jgi:hypothetical protein
MLERWLQVCRVKITFELLPNNWLVSTRKNQMLCKVDSIQYASLFEQTPSEMMWAEARKEKEKWYTTQGPGRMAQTPQAGTGDSLGRFCRYWWSTLINYNSNLSMCGTFLMRLFPHMNNRGLLPTPKETGARAHWIGKYTITGDNIQWFYVIIHRGKAGPSSLTTRAYHSGSLVYHY